MEKILEMGFSEEQALAVLEESGWDENEALQLLVN